MTIIRADAVEIFENVKIPRFNWSFYVSGNAAQLPLPKANINTYFSLRENCWFRRGVGGPFPRNVYDPKTGYRYYWERQQKITRKLPIRSQLDNFSILPILTWFIKTWKVACFRVEDKRSGSVKNAERWGEKEQWTVFDRVLFHGSFAFLVYTDREHGTCTG